MKTSTAYNHFKRLETQLRAIYSSAKIGLYPHAVILEESKKRVWNDPSLTKCPAWVRLTLQTISGELFNHIQHYCIVYAFDCDEEIPKLYDNMNQEEKEKFAHVATVNNPRAGHFWLREVTRHGKTWFETNGTHFKRKWELTNKRF